MNHDEEARLLRERYQALADRLDRLAAQGDPGAARFVGKVYSGGSIPTTVPKVFLTHPTTIFSPDTEGGTATAAVDTSQSVPVWCVGPGVPVANDYLVARGAPYAWVADFPGTSTSVCGEAGGWPSTVHFTCGSFSCTMGTGGSSIRQCGFNVTPPSGTSKGFDFDHCVDGTLAHINLFLDCVNVGGVLVPRVRYRVNFTWGSGTDCGFVQGTGPCFFSDPGSFFPTGTVAGCEATITTYTTSPLLVAGTFATTWNDPFPSGINHSSCPAPPISGSFTITP